MAHGIRAHGESFLSSTFGNDIEKKARRRRREKYPVPLMQQSRGKNKLKISNNITLSRLSNFMWQVWQLSTIIVEKFILNLIKFPSSPGPCLFVIFVIIFPIKN